GRIRQKARLVERRLPQAAVLPGLLLGTLVERQQRLADVLGNALPKGEAPFAIRRREDRRALRLSLDEDLRAIALRANGQAILLRREATEDKPGESLVRLPAVIRKAGTKKFRIAQLEPLSLRHVFG